MKVWVPDYVHPGSFELLTGARGVGVPHCLGQLCRVLCFVLLLSYS